LVRYDKANLTYIISPYIISLRIISSPFAIKQSTARWAYLHLLTWAIRRASWSNIQNEVSKLDVVTTCFVLPCLTLWPSLCLSSIWWIIQIVFYVVSISVQLDIALIRIYTKCTVSIFIFFYIGFLHLFFFSWLFDSLWGS